MTPAGYQVIAFRKSCYEQRQLFGQILKICVNGDDDVIACCLKSRGKRRRFAKISSEAQISGARVQGAEFFDLDDGTIRAAVIYEEDFIGVCQLIEYSH